MASQFQWFFEMTLKTQEVWSELSDEHFLVIVYDWVHATL